MTLIFIMLLHCLCCLYCLFFFGVIWWLLQVPADLTLVDFTLVERCVFFLLGGIPKSSRMASGLKGPQLCNPNLLAGKRGGDRLSKIKKTSMVCDSAANNDALRLHMLHQQGVKLSERVVTSQVSYLHWSQYPLDAVYVGLLLDVARAIGDFYTFRKGPNGTYHAVPRMNMLEASRHRNAIVLSWNSTFSNQVQYNSDVRHMPDCLLPKLAVDILMGVLLSDGGLHKAGAGALAANPNRNPYFETSMTARDDGVHLGQDIAVFCVALFEMLGLGYGMVEKRARWYNPRVPQTSGRSGLYFEYHFISARSMEWRLLEAMLYKNIVDDNRVKFVSLPALCLLSPIGWSFMLACDGSQQKGVNTMLHFCSFGVDGSSLMVNRLYQILGQLEQSSITVLDNNAGVNIVLYGQYSTKFLSMVVPYLPYSAYYKLNKTMIGVNSPHVFLQGPQRYNGSVVLRLINDVLLSN